MIRCDVATERWPLVEPFETARDAACEVPVVVATLTDAEGRAGRGEAAGVDYDGETVESMRAQIEGVRQGLDDALDGDGLLRLLPAGGARNALDCALWDLRARQSGMPVWRRAGLAPPRPLETMVTIGLGDEATTRRKVRAVRGFPLVKLKVDADRHLEVVRMVRDEHPAARLAVDANQAWTRPLLERLLPALAEAGVELVEQPVARGDDASLRGLRSPIPIAADESCTDRASLGSLAGLYDAVTIKLDKCGGLTEALALADAAEAAGFALMVGNMCGSSLAMAPGFLVGQRCRWVDLDGPLLQRGDRPVPMRYAGGTIDWPPSGLWG